MPSKDTILTTLVAVLAVAGGVFIGYADSHSDDAFVTLGVLMGFSFLPGLLQPRRPWLWAGLVGVWVPVLDTVLPRFGLAPQERGGPSDFLSGLALTAVVMAACFVGAFAGALLGRAARRIWHSDGAL
jgi:hypothetical protein